MARQKKVTGVRSAFVKVGTGDDERQVVVHHGDELPAGATADEIKRLEGLGVFADTPRYLLPLNERPPLTQPAAPAPAADTSELEAANAQLTADLEEANAKLAAAARLAPVVAGDVDHVNAYLADHPEDRDAIMFLESHGQKRKGVLDA